MNLTIIIPTKNRPDFLKRCLNFFNEQGCLFPILIGDSSSGRNLRKNLITIASFNKLTIKHIVEENHSKELKGWQTDFVSYILPKQIKTKYSCLIADDDFFFIDALEKGVEFLEKNLDYSFVTGKATIFELDEIYSKNFPRITTYNQRGYTVIEKNLRIYEFLSDYTVQEYGISRTSELKKRWEFQRNAKLDNLSSELLNCLMTISQGKSHKLSIWMFHRQSHSNMSSVTAKEKGQDYKWYLDFIKDEKRDKIIQILITKFKLNNKRRLERQLDYHIIKKFYQKKLNKNNISGFRRIINKISNFLKIYKLWISLHINNYYKIKLIKKSLNP